MTLFWFFSNGLIAILIAVLFQSISTGFMIVFCSSIIYLLIRNSGTSYFSIKVVFVEIVSILVVISIYWIYQNEYGTPYFNGGSDDIVMENISNEIINQRLYTLGQINSVYWKYNCVGYLWFLSWFMRICNVIGGYHTINARLLNVFLQLIVNLLVYKYLVNYCKLPIKKVEKAFIFFALFPNPLFIGAHVFRDTLCEFLIVCLFYVWKVILPNKSKTTKILICVGSFVCIRFLYWIRHVCMYMSIVMLGLILYDNFKCKKRRIRKDYNLKKCLLAITAISIIFVLLVYYNVFSYGLGIINRYQNIYLVGENANGHLTEKLLSINLIPFGVFVRIAYGLISPLPTALIFIPQIFSNYKLLIDIFIAFGTLFQIFMLPYLLISLKRGDAVAYSFLFYFTIVVCTTFGFRHVLFYYPFAYITITRSYILTSSSNKKICFACTLIAVSLAGIAGAYIKLM